VKVKIEKKKEGKERRQEEGMQENW